MLTLTTGCLSVGMNIRMEVDSTEYPAMAFWDIRNWRGRGAAVPSAGVTLETVPTQLTRVFLSYSRKDKKITDWLRARLEKAGIEVFQDVEDTLPGEQWWARLTELIALSDTVVFLLSPRSTASKVCSAEVAFANSLSKRIVPAVIEDVDWRMVPDGLSKLHSVYLSKRTQRDRAIADLVGVLLSDIGWLREHTRLLDRARRWDAKQRTIEELLTGPPLQEAEQWLSSQPASAKAPTKLHQEFIKASRDAERAVTEERLRISEAQRRALQEQRDIAEAQRAHAVVQRSRAYSRQLAAQASLGLADTLGDAEVPVLQALASLAIDATGEARTAVATGIDRLPPRTLVQLPLDPADGEPRDFAIPSDNAVVLGTTNKNILLWRLPGGELEHKTACAGRSRIVGFSDDRFGVVVTAENEASPTPSDRLRVVDISLPSVYAIDGIVLDTYSKHDTILAVICDVNLTSLSILDCTRRVELARTEFANSIQLARVNPTAEQITIVATNNQVSVRKLDLRTSVSEFDLPTALTPMAISFKADLNAVMARSSAVMLPHDGDHTNGVVAARGDNGDVTFYQLRDGLPAATVVAENDGEFLGFAGADRFMLVRGPSGVTIRDTAGVQIATLAHSRATDLQLGAMVDAARQAPTIDFATSEDGSLIATATKDGRITLMRDSAKPRYGSFGAMPMPNWEPVCTFDHGDQLGATVNWNSSPPLFMSGDGRFVASQSDGLKANAIGGAAAYNPTLRIWDAVQRKEIARFRPRGGLVPFFSRSTSHLVTLSVRKVEQTTSEGHTIHVEVPEAAVWQLLPDKELIARMHPFGTHPIADAQMFGFANGGNLSGLTPSADGARWLWTGTDGSLRVAEAGSNAAHVIDDLAPVARNAFRSAATEWTDYVACLTDQSAAMLRQIPTAVDPISELEMRGAEGHLGADEFVTELETRRAAGHIGPDPVASAPVDPAAPTPYFPMAISGNGQFAAVVIGPIVRLYDIVAHTCIAERRLPNYFSPIPRTHSVGDVVISHDGQTIAVTSTDMASFASAFARFQQNRDRTGASWTYESSIRVYSTDQPDCRAIIPQSIRFFNTYALASMQPVAMMRPLAIDSAGSRLIVHRVHAKPHDTARGIEDGETDIACINIPDQSVCFQTGRKPLNLVPHNHVAIRDYWTRCAAFSSDGRKAILQQTETAFPPAIKMTMAWMPLHVPATSDVSVRTTLFDCDTGRQVGATSKLSDAVGEPAAAEPNNPGPLTKPLQFERFFPGARQQLAVALRTAGSIRLDHGASGSHAYVETQVLFEEDALRLTIVAEPIDISDTPMMREARSRLPPGCRLSQAEWEKNFPGQRYPDTDDESNSKEAARGQ